MLDRQLGILYMLINRKTVTAAELAKRYEVSQRTIYRDIETLSIAGIPVYASKGRNGGIRLTEQFVLDKLLVTKKEQQEILSALKSLDEFGVVKGKDTITKLNALFQVDSQNWISIDFSDWTQGRKQCFEDIKQAILERKVLSFEYTGKYQEPTRREVEPVQLIFKDYTWYLKAYCRKRKAIRVFKLVRMSKVTIMSEMFTYDPAKHTCEEKEADEYMHGTGTMELQDPNLNLTKVKFLVKAQKGYRVYDYFSEDSLLRLSNGDIEITVPCSVDDWIIGIILSFGADCEVLEPEFVKDIVKKQIEEMNYIYESKQGCNGDIN